MANVLTNTYDPSKVIVTFGAVQLSGFAEGTFISIKRSGNVFEKKKGSDGTIERINKNAMDFSVEITLQQTSNSNLLLDALMKADMVANAGVLPLTITDLYGSTLFEAPQAWISKDPDVDFGDDTTNRTWTFETGVASLTIGGNALTIS